MSGFRSISCSAFSQRDSASLSHAKNCNNQFHIRKMSIIINLESQIKPKKNILHPLNDQIVEDYVRLSAAIYHDW